MKSYIYSIINKCGSKKSVTYLKVLSFIESIFFPIPTDVLLAPMVLSKKHNWINLAIIASLWSVLGGIIGYFLGFYLFELIEPYLYQLGKYNQYLLAKSSFEEYGIIFLFISAFTPVPYKIFTITAGVLNFNLLLFIIISFIGRSARFLLVSFICEKYDEQILHIINRYLLYVAIIALIILLLILWI
tara:strand:- start:1436 stop:1996 length:561 start_codon:yes stop_codon:yes gene_type:complete